MAFVASTYAEAQIVSSSSTTIEVVETKPAPKPKKKTQWYLRGGLNVMNFTRGGKYTEENTARAGYDLSIGFQKNMGSKGLFWGMDLGLGSRGWKYTEGDYKMDLIAHNIRWSMFDFGYKYRFKNNISMYAHANVYWSVDYAGRFKESYTGSSWDDEDGDSENTVDIFDNDYMDHNPVDLGMSIGVGMWWKRLNIDLTYQIGMLDATFSSDFNAGKTTNLMIRVGVGF